MKLAPAPPAEIPLHEAYPAALAAYDALTTDQALAEFGQRVAVETAQLAPGAEEPQASFLNERQYQWQRHGRLSFQAGDPAVAGLSRELTGHGLAEEQGFVAGDRFKQGLDTTRHAIVIDARDEPLEFPLSAIVSAEGFESWETGRGTSTLKDDKPSPAVIQDYASRSSEIPPVDHATAVILPDGGVAVMSTNAHRIAAAKLKGQATIKVRNLVVYPANQAVNSEEIPVGANQQ
jgi:hypothetical protein